MKRGRKPGRALPYTTGNITRHIWGPVADCPDWRTIATALMGHNSPAAVTGPEIEEAKTRLLTLVAEALEKKDRDFFVRLGKCVEALPADNYGADPLYLALRSAEVLIHLQVSGMKGKKINRQDLVSVALEQFPQKTGNELEKTRRALFRKVAETMPWVKSARDQLRKKVTKRRVTRST